MKRVYLTPLTSEVDFTALFGVLGERGPLEVGELVMEFVSSSVGWV